MGTTKTLNGSSTATEHAVQQITTRTDSREILANARRDIARYHLDEYFIVDVDAHHVEFDSWGEILDRLENPVLRHNAKTMTQDWPRARQLAFSNHPVGMTFQDVSAASRTRPSWRSTSRRRTSTATSRSCAAPWIRWESECKSCFRSRCSKWACIPSPIS